MPNRDVEREKTPIRYTATGMTTILNTPRARHGFQSAAPQSPDKVLGGFQGRRLQKKNYKSNTDLRLRMTMLTDDLTEVAIANGYIQKNLSGCCRCL